MEWAFFDLGVLFIMTASLALLARLARQPLLIAYIATGLLAAPLASRLPANTDLVLLFSTLGTTLLLFLVGLELDIHRLKALGRTALAVSLGQLLLTSVLGFLLGKLVFGLPTLESLFIGAAVAFSSTIVVVRHLSLRHDLGSLHGKLSTYLLLVQDLAALIVLISLGAVSGQHTTFGPVGILLKGLLLLLLLLELSRSTLPVLFSQLARSEELLFVTSLAWCFLIALTAKTLGFSFEIGAFLAGLSLAALPYSAHISGRIKPLRDFFVTIFFIALGIQAGLAGGHLILWHVVMLVAFALLLKPLIVLFLMGQAGYRPRVNLLTALSQSQFSEFSLLVMALGLHLGVVSANVAAEITLATILAMIGSSYLLTFDHELADVLRPLGRMLQGQRRAVVDLASPPADHWILFGCGNLGQRLLKAIRRLRGQVTVVDFDPEVIDALLEENTDAHYGDLADEEMLGEVNATHAKHIISTIRDGHDTLRLLTHLRRLHYRGTIIVTAMDPAEALEAYDHGADYVMLPILIGAEYVADLLRDRLSGDPKSDKRFLRTLQTEQQKLLSKLLAG